MKRRTILNLFLIFGIVTSLWTISIVQAAPLAIDDKFESTMKEQWKFKDRFGFDYDEERITNINTAVTGVNATWVNYTEIQKINPIVPSTLPPANNGEWSISTLNGEVVTTTNSEFNRTVDPYLSTGVQYVDFRWMDYLDWNNNTAGTEFRNWNTTQYSNRFINFDMDMNSALDEFLLDIVCPAFVDNVTKYIEIIESQWRAFAYFDMSGLSILSWNSSATSWISFRSNNLYQNVAYSATLISTDSGGDAEIIEFTPQWIGQNWYPLQFDRWNGTDWVDRYDLLYDYATMANNPVVNNGTHDVLREDYGYFSISVLRQRRIPLNEVNSPFKNIKETFTANSFSIEFEVEIEDIDRFSYHTSANWTDKMRNNGTLDYTQKCKYNSEKGYIESSTLDVEYDFGENGIYREIITLNPGSGGGVPGFEFPVLFFSLVSIALIIRRRKRK